MDIVTDSLSWDRLHSLLSGCIVPRPIAWVTSVDADENVNVGPFSFFNVVSALPPTLVISANAQGQSKDTVRNAEQVGEIVVNIITEELLPQANATSIDAPPRFNEAAYAELPLVNSRRVRPPSISGSPIHLECRVSQIIPIGVNQVIVAEVLLIHIDDRVWDGKHVDQMALRAVGRMGGSRYCRTSDMVALDRPGWPPS